MRERQTLLSLILTSQMVFEEGNKEFSSRGKYSVHKPFNRIHHATCLTSRQKTAICPYSWKGRNGDLISNDKLDWLLSQFFTRQHQFHINSQISKSRTLTECTLASSVLLSAHYPVLSFCIHLGQVQSLMALKQPWSVEFILNKQSSLHSNSRSRAFKNCLQCLSKKYPRRNYSNCINDECGLYKRFVD